MSKQKVVSVGDVKPLVRLLKFLPKTNVILIVLMGHLAIEEQLVSLLKCSIKHAAALDEKRAPRFTFAHRLALVKSMNLSPENPWLWRSIQNLNTLRNDLVHNLEPAKLSRRIKDFLHSVEGLPILSKKHESIESRLGYALIFLSGQLQSIQKKHSPDIV